MTLSIDQLRQVSYLLDQPKTNWNGLCSVIDVKEGIWGRFKFCLFENKEPKLLRITQAFNKVLAIQEQQGVKIFDPAIVDEKYQQMAQDYRDRFSLYFNIADQIKRCVGQLKKTSPEFRCEYH